MSDPCPITSGVPQGSILGPLLFVLFVNDLPLVLKRCQILMYADDTVIYFTGKDAQEIENTLTNELVVVHQWMLDNNLFIHKGKTECILFGTGPRLANASKCSVGIDGQDLNRVSEYQYLGVIFDESLTWNAQVKYLLSKAGKRIGMLGRTGRTSVCIQQVPSTSH